MLLSILICHLTNRKALLERLMKCLQPQVDKANANGAIVEVLVEADNGKISTGEKRNRLLARASGTHCCFQDDDDEINPCFVELVLEALKSNPDCVSLEGEMDRMGHPKRRFSHSLKHGADWREEMSGQRRYLRPPNHINTVRTVLAREAGFPNKVVAEDLEYSKRLFPLLKTESVIDEILYYYHA